MSDAQKSKKFDAENLHLEDLTTEELKQSAKELHLFIYGVPPLSFRLKKLWNSDLMHYGPGDVFIFERLVAELNERGVGITLGETVTFDK